MKFGNIQQDFNLAKRLNEVNSSGARVGGLFNAQWLLLLFGCLNHSHLFLPSIKSRAACASLDFFVFPAYKSELLTLLNKKIPTLCVEISFVTPFGFEPKTYCLEGSCSIQLSYGANIIVQLLRFVSPFLSIKKGG